MRGAVALVTRGKNLWKTFYLEFWIFGENLDMKIEKKLKHTFNSWILAGTFFRYPALVPARIPAHAPARILALFLLPKFLPELLPVFLSELLPMFLLIFLSFVPTRFPALFLPVIPARFFPARCNFFPDM